MEDVRMAEGLSQEGPASSSLRELTGHSGNPPGQGPFITLHLTIAGSRVTAASYETYQCPGCHACGKAICELVAGKTIEEARALKRDDVALLVGPLPKHRQLCYSLAILALSDALVKCTTEPEKTT